LAGIPGRGAEPSSQAEREMCFTRYTFSSCGLGSGAGGRFLPVTSLTSYTTPQKDKNELLFPYYNTSVSKLQAQSPTRNVKFTVLLLKVHVNHFNKKVIPIFHN
jgi:hypothetical protein